MRVDSQGDKITSDSVNLAEADHVEKYDPTADKMGEWFALFMDYDYARANPEIAIYARVLSRMRWIAVRDPRICPMMGVVVREGQHLLLYNPTWAEQAGYLEFACTLMHEGLHILSRDIPRFFRRMALFPEKERPAAHKLLNVALDCANNHLLAIRNRHMRYGTTGPWLFPEQFGMKENLDAETYFEILLAHRENLMEQIQQMIDDGTLQMISFKMPSDEGDGEGEGQSPGEGEGDGDEQDGEGQGGEQEQDDEGQSELMKAIMQLHKQNAHDWAGDNISEKSPEELNAEADHADHQERRMMISALKQHQKMVGKLPAHMQNTLDSLLAEAEVPWSAILRRLVAARMMSKRRTTMTRPAKRRYVLHVVDEETGELKQLRQPLPIFPGSKRSRTYVIMYVLDTSGSMNEADVIDGLSELQGIVKTEPDAHCIVVQCDTHISHVDILGPDMDVEEYVKAIGRTSQGGTTFERPFELAQYIHKLGPLPGGLYSKEDVLNKIRPYDYVDLMVYHTDGYAGAVDRKLQPPCPVLWLLTKQNSTDSAVTFGQVIER